MKWIVSNPDEPSCAWETNSGLYIENVSNVEGFANPLMIRSEPTSGSEHLYPSPKAARQGVNTVEIVKKGGNYLVVIDGVAHNAIEDGGTAHYWLPRFKELSNADGSRSVCPLLVAMRLEDNEAFPETCTLHVTQRVEDDGAVLMNNEEVNEYAIKPYSSGGATCNVLALPYPIITTPEPHLYVNDYESTRDVEAAITLSYAPEKKRLPDRNMGAVLVQRSDRKNRAQPATATGNNEEEEQLSSGDDDSDSTYEPSGSEEEAEDQDDPSPGDQLEKMWERETLLKAMSRRIVRVRNKERIANNEVRRARRAHRKALRNVQEANVAVYENDSAETREARDEVRKAEEKVVKNLENMTNLHKKAEADLDAQRGELIHTLFSKYATLPDKYRIDVSDIARILRGLTKSINSKDSARDPKYIKSKKDLAFVEWLIEGERVKKFDKLTGLLDSEERKENYRNVTEKSEKGVYMGNTLDRTGMDPRTACNTKTQMSYTIKIRERDGRTGPTIHLQATPANGADAGWVASAIDKVIKDITNTMQELLTTIKRENVHPSLLRYNPWVQRSNQEIFDLTYDQEKADSLAERIKRGILGVDYEKERDTVSPTNPTNPDDKTASVLLHKHFSVSESDAESVEIVDTIMLHRFVQIHYSGYPETGLYKGATLSSFLVPRCDPERSLAKGELLRIMPQIISFSENYSFQAPLKVATKRVDVREILSNGRSVKACVQQMDSSLRRLASARDLSQVIIYNGSKVVPPALHFVQVYKRKYDTASDFGIRVDESLLPPDLVAMSSLPSIKTIEETLVANESGGEPLVRSLRVATGYHAGGVHNLLKEAGCETNVGGMLALATFCEMFALLFLESVFGNKLVTHGLRAQELVSSIHQRTSRAARRVSKFLSTHCAPLRDPPVRIARNDVAFYCLPDMQFMWIALKMVGIVQNSTVSERQTFPELRYTQKMLVRSVATSLLKMGSQRNLDLSKLPFVCMQSLLPSLPPALQDRGDVVSEHVRALFHSYRRIVLMTKLLSTNPKRSSTALGTRIDCFNSRPVFLVAASTNLEAVKIVLSKAEDEDTQKDWKIPAAQLNNTILRHRLACTRVDAEAIYEKDEMARWEKADGYARLVSKMTQLQIGDGVATFMIPFGMYGFGTPLDLAHMNFESRPVWISLLLAEAEAVLYEKDNSESGTLVQMEGGVVGGRPRHPSAVTVSSSEAGVTVISVHVANGARGTGGLRGSDGDSSSVAACEREFGLTETQTLLGAFEAVKRGNVNCPKLAQGRSESYRSTMHNAERIFQAGCVIASRIHCSVPERGAAATMRMSEDNPTSWVNATVAACVGNAMTLSATGVAARILPPAYGNATSIAKEIAAMCKSLDSEGIKAVPVCELCACLACL